MKSKNSRLVTGLFLEAIALCLIMSFRFINIAATVTLLIFNLFFLSLTIHLNGTLNRKLGTLVLGNITGLLWNFTLQYFAIAGTTFFGEPFNLFYTVSYPFLNFMWIVPFWSLSLAVRPTRALKKPRDSGPRMITAESLDALITRFIPIANIEDEQKFDNSLIQAIARIVEVLPSLEV